MRLLIIKLMLTFPFRLLFELTKKVSNKFNKAGSMLDRPKVCKSPTPGTPPLIQPNPYIVLEIVDKVMELTQRWVDIKACSSNTNYPNGTPTITAWYANNGIWNGNKQILNNDCQTQRCNFSVVRTSYLITVESQWPDGTSAIQAMTFNYP